MVQLELYIKEPIDFLRTVTLKNSLFADHILYKDVQLEYQDILPDALNPYYRHMCGEYILDGDTTVVNGKEIPNKDIYKRLDTMMYITSLDTQEQVPFTKEMLNKHPKTASMYRIPGTYYSKLSEKYPQYTDLIKSIVYPINSVEDAVAADNLTILQYDENLLKSNERSSILEALNKTLTMIRERWTVREFTYEDMFAVVHQGIIWQLLYLTIFAQRILNIRTSKVHEFHIWNYLTSKGLGDYRDVLSLNQALFFYRNINYLLQNKGTQKNFSILIGSLLKPLNVALYSKSIVQNTMVGTSSVSNSTTLQTRQIPSGKTKTVSLTKDNLSESFANTCKPYPQILSNSAGDDDIITQAAYLVNNYQYSGYGKAIDVVQTVLNQYQMGAIPNSLYEVNNGTLETTKTTYDKERESYLEYQDEHLFNRETSKQDYKFSITPHTYLKTKAHEINKIITSTLYNQIYAKFVEESLYYRLAEKDLNFSLTLTPPDTKITIVLDANQAMALLIYAACKESGITLERPPTKARVFWPYKKEFPEIPEYFYYQEHKRSTAGYLSDYGFSDMVAYPNPFLSPLDMTEKIHDQALNFLTNFIEVHKSASSIHYEILMKVYQQRCVNQWIQFSMLGGSSYQELFYQIDGLQEVIEQYDNSEDSELSYSNLFTALMDVFYPLEQLPKDTPGLDLLSDSERTLSERYSRIKSLFVEMCSYNVTFFDQIEGMTNTSTMLCRLTFDTQSNLNIDQFKFFWYEFCTQWKNFCKWREKWLVPIDIQIKGPDDYIYQFVWCMPDFTYTRVVFNTIDYFIPCQRDIAVYGQRLPRYRRRYSNYRDAIEVDLGSDPELYEMYDLPREQKQHYSSAHITYLNGSKIVTYNPYQNQNPTNGITIIRDHLDLSAGDTTGSVTPVYKDGKLIEVIEERVHSDDVVPDYRLVTNDEITTFEKINH